MPTIGTNIYGRPAVACAHWAQTWPLVTRLWGLRFPTAHPLEIVQALGSAAASAGTHGSPGTALDLRTYRYTSTQIQWLVQMLRNAGADATWYRNWDGNRHIHSALDCPCVSPADYQITAVRQGYNGLGSGGRKGVDDGPPVSRRNHAAGLAWLRSEIARYNPQSAVLGTHSGGLTMSEAAAIKTDTEYIREQLKAIAEGTMGRDALNARNAEVATIVKAATDAQSRVLIDAFGKLGVSTVDMNALKLEVRTAVAEALDGATLSIKAG